jgi:hypothetical protein
MTEAGEPAFQTKYHGRAIQMKGRVISVPQTEEYNRLVMECDRQMVHVDASSCPESLRNVEVDCTISAAGTCLMDTGNWHPNAPFPHIEGFSIIVRTPADIKILAYPPWWTAGRLSAVIGAIIYYVVITLVLRLGLESTDLKLLTALVVALFLAIPYWKSKKHAKRKEGAGHA